MTTRQIADLIAPSEESIHTVVMWLQTNHILNYDISATRDLISFKTDAITAEKVRSRIRSTFFLQLFLTRLSLI